MEKIIDIDPSWGKEVERSWTFGPRQTISKRLVILKKTDMSLLRETLGYQKDKLSPDLEIAFNNRKQRNNFIKKTQETEVRRKIDKIREEILLRKYNALLNNMRKAKRDKEFDEREREFLEKFVSIFSKTRVWWKLRFLIILTVAEHFCQKKYI